MTPSGPNTSDPLYLGHSLEQWLTDFVAAEEVDDADLVCQALPCFGEAFIRRAVELIDTVGEAKHALLVSCIANAGRSSVPSLVRLLAHSSAKVRAAACTGLAEALDAEPDNSPAIVQMMRDFHPWSTFVSGRVSGVLRQTGYCLCRRRDRGSRQLGRTCGPYGKIGRRGRHGPAGRDRGPP